MPKVKIPRKSTNIDMTAMCDVAFLLLTFFMLATKFKPDEPVVVKTPASISEIPLPDTDVMLITLDKDGRIFFSIENKGLRKELVQSINTANGLGLTEEEMNMFAIGASIGTPFSQLKAYLSAPPEARSQYDKTVPGIPADTAGITRDNELAQWITNARQLSGNKLRVCIKADADAVYPDYKKVIRTLENLKIFKFNLITDLKAVPAGTAAYEKQMASLSKQN
jgi:biopolymer transport protein ExbD